MNEGINKNEKGLSISWREKTIQVINTYYDETIARQRSNWNKWQKFNQIEGKKICLFGAGGQGHYMYPFFKKNGIKIDFFCDNNEQLWEQDIVDGIQCISPKELFQWGENVLVFITVGPALINEIFNQVGERIKETYRTCEMFQYTYTFALEQKYEKNDVITQVKKLFGVLSDEQSQQVAFRMIEDWLRHSDFEDDLRFYDVFSDYQYFLNQGEFLDCGEVMIDCGAFNGDTLNYLLKKINFGDFDRYICYELAQENYEQLTHFVAKLDKEIRKKIEIYNDGVGDISREIHYQSLGTSSNLNDIGDACGQIISLDERHSGERITYIKMDVEGNELSALNGAKNIIKQQKPKCAICIYHKIEDLWQIPLLLKQLVPEYQIFIRHHALNYFDTVCYAL